MTRKDYEMLAAVIRGEFSGAVNLPFGPTRSARMSAISQTARAIADAIARENKAFSVDLFLYNAGVTV